MNAVRNVAFGLVLTVAFTCAAISAPPQNQPLNGDLLGRNPQYPEIAYGGQNKLPNTVGLAQQYVKADKDGDKKDIRKKLTDALSQQFDQHIQVQQKELEDLEKQITNLKAVLKKRLDAKPVIVERRAEQLIQEAEGLGWTAPSRPHAANPYFGNLWDAAPAKMP